MASMTSGSPGSVMFAAAFVERGVESRAVLGDLPPRPIVLAQQLEQRGRILPLQAFLHVLRGDDRVVVLGDDSARHRAHLAERPGAPRAEHAERQHEAGVPEQQLGPQLHRAHPPDASSSAPIVSPPTGTICTVALRTSRRKRSTIEPCSSRSQRDRADWPKMTWVMPSRFANSTSASATREPFSLTTFAPSCLREADVVRQRDVIVGLDAARLLVRRLDVDGEPVRRQPAGDARADAQQRSSRCRATPSPPSPSRE